MNRIRFKISVRYLPVVVGGFVLAHCAACSDYNDHIVAILGTEMVTLPSSPWGISVSQDEKWLVFWELSRGVEHPYDGHLCTLDLETGKKTVHNIERVRDQMTSYSNVDPWGVISSDFYGACWPDGGCYVPMYIGFAWRSLVFVPGVPGGDWSPVTKNLGCSDCPPRGRAEAAAEHIVGRWILNHPRLFSLPKSVGQSETSLYHIDRSYDGASIVRTDSSGSHPLVQHPHRRFRNARINALRVSPNERYLAYGLFLKLRSPIPLPDQEIELYVHDLVEGEEYTISTRYRDISNLIWSPDSERLYFAGFQGEKRAVYQVDVAGLLGGR
jgi:hypothetical protein